MTTARAAVIGMLLFTAGCGGGGDDDEDGEAVSLDAEDAVLALANAGLPVELTVVYTDETDPNKSPGPARWLHLQGCVCRYAHRR